MNGPAIRVGVISRPVIGRSVARRLPNGDIVIARKDVVRGDLTCSGTPVPKSASVPGVRAADLRADVAAIVGACAEHPRERPGEPLPTASSPAEPDVPIAFGEPSGHPIAITCDQNLAITLWSLSPAFDVIRGFWRPPASELAGQRVEA